MAFWFSVLVNNNKFEFRRIYLVKNDFVFEILDSDADIDFYKKVINSIKIK